MPFVASKCLLILTDIPRSQAYLLVQVFSTRIHVFRYHCLGGVNIQVSSPGILITRNLDIKNSLERGAPGEDHEEIMKTSNSHQ